MRNRFRAAWRESARGLGRRVSAWYLTSGVTPGDCEAAYLPKAAASLAESYTNLAHPGQHTITADTPPTLDDGWKFAGSEYLKTDLIETANSTTIVWYSGAQDVGQKTLFGCFNTGSTPNRQRSVFITNTFGSHNIYNGGTVKTVGGNLTDGFFALVGSNAYEQGDVDATGIETANVGTSTWIGATHRSDDVAIWNATVTIHGWVSYNKLLTQDQIKAIINQMQLAGYSYSNYETAVRNTFGSSLVRFWPLTETVGRMSYDLSGRFGNGTHNASVTLNNVALPDGKKVPTYGGTAFTTAWNAALPALYNPSEGTILLLAKIANAEWADGKARNAIGFAGANEFIYLAKSTYGYAFELARHVKNPLATRQLFFNGGGITDWLVLGVTWSATGNYIRLFSDGILSCSIPFDTGWAEAIVALYTNIATQTSGTADKFIGALGEPVLANRPATPTEMRSLAQILYPTTANLFVIGDSKCADAVGGWIGILRQYLSDDAGMRYIEQARFAIGGYDIGEMKVKVQNDLSSVTGDAPALVIIAVGANDIPQPTPEAEFKADFQAVINAVRAKWPGVPIYIPHCWQRNYDANSATINGYIDWVIAQYASNVFAGPSEVTVIKAGDDGATNTADGIHYSTAGKLAWADAWKTLLGI